MIYSESPTGSSENIILPYIRKGDELHSCSFGLGTRQIKFDAQVTQIKRVNEKAVRVDCRFKSLTPDLEEAIASLLSSMS